MRRDVLDEVARLRAAGRPFALATVVAARQPTSGTPGARAIIIPEGKLNGWIGGSCVQPTIIREGLAALADGQPRLVVLSPDAPPGPSPREGVISVAMTCAGQGEVQVFVEPFVPAPALVVVGASPVARALVRLASTLEFEVWACDSRADMAAFPEADRLVPDVEALQALLTARNYVVVATFGQYDEVAVRAALESPASYVGLIASRKRLAAIVDYLQAQGLSDDLLARLKRPEGLPGHVQRPEEIAFSVMAELLEARRQRIGMTLDATPAPRAEAVDPICGMTVDIATSTYHMTRDGETFYFCCAGCQRQFEAA